MKHTNKLIVLSIIITIAAVLAVMIPSSLYVQLDNFFKNLFMLKYLPNLGNKASFAVLFVLGLLSSFHCIGMCGGIAISQCVKREESNMKKDMGYKTFRPSLLYNSGRIVSYTLMGAVVGEFGQIISLSGIFAGIIPIIGGIFMVIMAVNILGIFPLLRKMNLSMPLFAARKIYGKNNYSPLVIGLFTGLMPCAPLQIVQLYALGTRSIFLGAESMFFFSIGTVPVVFAFGVINTVINKKFSKILLKASGVLVLVLGIVMIGRGLSLYGVSAEMKDTASKSGGQFSMIQGSVQKVRTEVGVDNFPPIEVVKGVKVRWILHVDAKNLNDCNKSIQIPEYKIKKSLKAGDNVIEFVPYKAGQFVYSCWMGMIKSKITVVNNFEKLKQNQMEKGEN